MWSLGVLIGGPIAVLCILVGIAWAVLCFRNREAVGWAGIAFAVAVLIVCALPGVGYYPYKAQYHRYDDKSGVVTDVNKRIVGSNGDINQKFVVRFKGSRQEYGCEDTRCAVIAKGDHVTLACKRTWQYAGSDGWDCKFSRNGGAS